MKPRLVRVALVILALTPTGPAPGGAEPGADEGLLRLVRRMSGSFSSAEQAAADTNYFDVRLTMTPIWNDRTDGIWLYVEQAMAARMDKPYRQRVYRVTRKDDSTYESAVFTLPDPLRFAGAWKAKRPLALLTPDSLMIRDGCSIILRMIAGGVYAGSTAGQGCSSDLRGAAYATSEVTIGDSMLVSWDRGFDRNGHQVWGATGGGYRFKKSGGRP